MSHASLKLVGLLRRRPDLSLSEFARHWRTHHRDLALRLIAPGIMLGYTQNHRLEVDGDIDGLEVAGDGFPELWVADSEVLTRIADAPEYRDGAYLDEPNFMDGRSQSMVACEHVVLPGAGPFATATQVKAMIFFQRSSGASLAAFREAFLRDPQPLMLQSDSQPLRVTRHVSITLPLDTRSECDAIQAYDGIEASYWPDADSFRMAWQARNKAAGESQIWHAAVGVLVHEEPVLVPAHAGPLGNEYA